MKKLIFILEITAMLFLAGCLQERKSENATTATNSWFIGAAAAQNLGGYPSSVKVSWARADRSVLRYNIYSLRANSSGVSTWHQVGSVDDSQTSFVDTQELLDGIVYTYKVQAVEAVSGTEDGNDKQVSTVTFYGINGVTITGKTTAIISLSGIAGAFDSIRIYATPKSGGVKKLITTVSGNPESVAISGLRSGVNYNFSANAYMSFLTAEDGNVRTVAGQTWSDGFGSGLTTDSSYYYRGALNVQGFGTAPNATSGPVARQINLTWLPFSNGSSATKYKIIRSATTTVNAAVTAACTPTATASCVVCTVTGSTYCEDLNVGAPPSTYYYALTTIKTDSSGADYAEELPCQNGEAGCSATGFLVKAAVPPDYMVLVQRDAANYDMCLNINTFSDPRHNQRCIYTGLGAVPTTTGPTKPVKSFDSGYYDFGYNLFVDRYKVACNWTKSSTTCGPNGCIGILNTLNTTTPPDSSVGIEGNVFYGFHGSSSFGYQPTCYLKTDTGWKGVGINSSTLTSAQLASAVTNDPGPTGDKHRPPLTYISPDGASGICNSQATEYGRKRLLRRREYIVSTPLPYISGEPNYRVGMQPSNAPNNEACNPTLTKTTSLTDWLASSNSLVALIDGTYFLNTHGGDTTSLPSLKFLIGSEATKSCVSRFGIQDPVGYGVIFSDNFVRTNGTVAPPTVQATSSDYDAGNADHGNFAFNGGLGPIHYASGISTWGVYYSAAVNTGNWLTCSSLSAQVSSFIPPLGLPVCTWSGSPQNLRSILEYQATSYLGSLESGPLVVSHNFATISIVAGNYLTYNMASGYLGRFSSGMMASGSNINGYSNLLCALEAE